MRPIERRISAARATAHASSLGLAAVAGRGDERDRVLHAADAHEALGVALHLFGSQRPARIPRLLVGLDDAVVVLLRRELDAAQLHRDVVGGRGMETRQDLRRRLLEVRRDHAEQHHARGLELAVGDQFFRLRERALEVVRGRRALSVVDRSSNGQRTEHEKWRLPALGRVREHLLELRLGLCRCRDRRRRLAALLGVVLLGVVLLRIALRLRVGLWIGSWLRLARHDDPQNPSERATAR